MKRLKKMMALIIAVAMVMAMALPVMAATQTVAKSSADADGATITVNNPSKGETYSAIKLFDATTTADGKISYQGTIPTTMTDYFEETSTGSGYVQAKVAAFKNVTYFTDASKNTVSETETAFWSAVPGSEMSDGLKAALEAWVSGKAAEASGTSDGSEALQFTGLPYGYYIITTSHEDETAAKCLITVDSTNPTASVYDKNVNTPSADKTVDDAAYNIGDTVKYKADFDTTNYLKDDTGKYWQVIEYTISDTLPAFLDSSTVKVTKLTIDGTDYKVSDAYPQFADKKIVIPWATKRADNKYTNDYANGVKIHIEYEATLTSTARVNAENKNTISILPKVTDDTTEKPWEEDWHDDAVITTYATALKKTDGTNALAGAKFRIAGLKATKTDDGVYTVTSYDSTVTATKPSDLTDDNSTELEVGADGKLYIIGIDNKTDDEDSAMIKFQAFETKAPDGYNQKMDATELSAQVLSKEVIKKSGWRKYDTKGNIIEEAETETTDFTQVTKNLSELDAGAVTVVNQQGQELPSTGGIGTTIFYVVGAILVIGAGVILITRRRMDA